MLAVTPVPPLPTANVVERPAAVVAVAALPVILPAILELNVLIPAIVWLPLVDTSPLLDVAFSATPLSLVFSSVV